MGRYRKGFSLVEVVIVVLILSILAMIVVPKIAVSSQEAKDAALSADLKMLRRQLEVYKQQHGGKTPDLGPTGAYDLANFLNRMTGKTQPSGAVDANGACGPYVTEWPSNPFVDESKAQSVTFGMVATSPRNGTSGWYYSLTSKQIFVNSALGAKSIDQAAIP